MQIAVYYFPNYHQDARNEAEHGKNWTEWDLVKKATPRFENHFQPNVPLWGYEDESKPEVMAKKIDAAADHGIDAFIFDWYYYNDGTFLERALTEGFCNAPNQGKLKYALMWANHDWVDIHPLPENGEVKLLYPGAITEETFEKMIDYIIAKHFKHPSYWLIDGCPYFSIYEIFRLAEGLGGWEQAKTALNKFRAKVKAAGFKDLHLNAVVWGVQILPGENTITHPEEIITELNFDSVTSYVWGHHATFNQFPVTPFSDIFEQNRQYWHEAKKLYSVPYYPNVSMGWDSSPRTVQSIDYVSANYPMMATMSSTPEEFGEALKVACDFVKNNSLKNQIITINAWNEWTEGSYLEPDMRHGFKYLEAIKEAIKLNN